MTLDDLLARHGRVLTDTRLAGEDATWHFAGGAPDRAVRVVVDRLLLEPANGLGAPAAAVRVAKVWLARSESIGVLQVADGDEITVRMRVGGTLDRCRIVEILSEDPGGFLLQVQR